MLFVASGSLALLNSYASATDDNVLRKLKAKGMEKFLAFDILMKLARDRYGARFPWRSMICPRPMILGSSITMGRGRSNERATAQLSATGAAAVVRVLGFSLLDQLQFV